MERWILSFKKNAIQKIDMSGLNVQIWLMIQLKLCSFFFFWDECRIKTSVHISLWDSLLLFLLWKCEDQGPYQQIESLEKKLMNKMFAFIPERSETSVNSALFPREICSDGSPAFSVHILWWCTRTSCPLHVLWCYPPLGDAVILLLLPSRLFPWISVLRDNACKSPITNQQLGCFMSVDSYQVAQQARKWQ